MANIDHYLEDIEVASRGEEVRDSIIDAFEALNSEGPGTMDWDNITDTPDTLTGYGVSDVPASMVSGVLALNNIPPSALERVVPVADDTARFALTSSDVQNGDTVKVLSTLKLYLVVDDTSLSTEAGYEEYRAGTADSVDWSGVLNTPDTLAGYGIEDAYTKDEVDDITTSAVEVAKQNAIGESASYTDAKLATELAPILGDLATAETSPASASHAVGEYLLYNKRLYKVLAAISAGQQLTIGTNIGQTNVAAELASQASAISVLNSNKLGQIPRCKDITSYFTDGTLWNRISGTGYPHAYYDIQPGDYIDMGRTITCPNIQQDTYGTVGSRYVTVVSLGGLQGNGDSSAVTYNHLVMVPGQGLGGSQHFGRHRMNPTNTTEGGYVGGQMFTDILGAVVSAGSVATGATINQQLYYVFGSHLKTTRELLSNAVGTSLYNRFGSATGASSRWAWTSVQACLMSEVEVYGSVVWSSSAYDTGSACKQFELFAQSKAAINNRSAYYWLKDVASSSAFAYVDANGYASYNSASYAGGFVRPRFIIA